jgi:hypothetical protein
MKFKKGLCLSMTLLMLFGEGKLAKVVKADSLPATAITNEVPQPALAP